MLLLHLVGLLHYLYQWCAVKQTSNMIYVGEDIISKFVIKSMGLWLLNPENGSRRWNTDIVVPITRRHLPEDSIPNIQPSDIFRPTKHCVFLSWSAVLCFSRFQIFLSSKPWISNFQLCFRRYFVPINNALVRERYLSFFSVYSLLWSVSWTAPLTYCKFLMLKKKTPCLLQNF